MISSSSTYATTIITLAIILITLVDIHHHQVEAFCGKGAPGFGVNYETVCKRLYPMHFNATFQPAHTNPYSFARIAVIKPSSGGGGGGGGGSGGGSGDGNEGNPVVGRWLVSFNIVSKTTELLQGYVIQARDVHDKPVGTFEIINRTKLTCDNDTLTQMGKHNHSERGFKWVAPQGFHGYVVLRATVLSNATIFWRIRSKPVYIGETDFINSIARTVNVFNSSNHGYRIKWYTDELAVHFQMIFKVDSNDYAAIGLSKDKKMGSDSVVACFEDGVKMSWNKGRTNINLKDDQYNLVPSYSSFQRVDDHHLCTFAIYRSSDIRSGRVGGTVGDDGSGSSSSSDGSGGSGDSGGSGSGGTNGSGSSSSSSTTNVISGNTAQQDQDSTKVLYPDDGEHYILVAVGPTNKGRLKTHRWTEVFGPVSFESEGLKEIHVDQKYGIKVHGLLMVLAWSFSASIAIILPRYFKVSAIRIKIFDKPFWFATHLAMFGGGMLMTVASFILIFIEIGSYSEVPGIGAAHPVLGIIVTALVIVNPVMSLFRCDIGTKNRWIFNLFHYTVGQLAYILAFITIFLSAHLPKLALPHWWWGVVLGQIIWQGVVEFLLYALRLQKQSATKSRKEKESETQENGVKSQNNMSRNLNVIPPRLLLLHLIVVTIFNIFIIIGIFQAT